jgi:multiple sugar transport system permease protein
MPAASYEGQRRRFVRMAIAPSLIFLLVVAGLPTLFLLVTSLTPGALVNPGSLGDFSDPLRNYKLLGGDERFVGSLRGAGAAVGVHGGAAGVAGHGARAAGALGAGALEVAAPPVRDSDGAAAHRGGGDLEAGLHARHQPRLPGRAHARLCAARAHHARRLRAVGHRHRRHLGVGAVHLPDGAGRAADAAREYVEAARMDGADAWRVFGHIVLPYIAPVLLVCTLFRLIDSIKAFPLIFLLTGGGPGSVTEVTNYYAYLVAFNFGELGYSSAITVVLLVATVLISWGAMRLSRNAGATE